MNAREQRLGDVGHRLGTKPPPDERRDRLIVGLRSPRDEQLGAHSQLRAEPEQRAVQHRPDARGKSEHRRAGQRVQLPVAKDEGRARELGGEEAIAKPQLVAERDRGRFLHEQRVGAGVDDQIAHPLGLDDAARTLGALEHHHRSLALAELVGGRQAGDTAANDGDVDGFDSRGVRHGVFHGGSHGSAGL